MTFMVYVDDGILIDPDKEKIESDPIPNHVPFTRILIPIPFPRENPIPHSGKIHDRIHSRSSRLYLSLFIQRIDIRSNLLLFMFAFTRRDAYEV
jgi:hypothetical protein